MASLKTVGSRFDTLFVVIAGGSGYIRGELTETEQNSQPSYVFVAPRHVLRTRFPTPVKAGMVIRAPAGDVFIIGENGPSETSKGTIWQSFRLFEATGQYNWTRRKMVIDTITKQEKDTGQRENLGLIWAALEPLDRQQVDRELHYAFGQSRIITGAPIHSDDIVDNRTVSKLDKQLGLSIGLLT